MLPRLLGLTLPAALTAVLLSAPPAQAAVTGTTSSPDVVLKNKCRTHEIDYTVLVDPGTLVWKLKITVVSPSGRTSEGIDVSSSTDATTGTVGVLLCGSAEPGTYTVHSVGIYQIVPLLDLPVTVADSTFEVRRTPTRTALMDQHLRGDHYRLIASVKDQRRHGFKPTDSAEVLFECKVNGVWKVIRGSRALTDDGRATAVISAPAGTKVRAVTDHAGYLGGSTSRAVRLRR